MGLQRGDRDVHPVAKWQRVQKIVELRFVAGAVETEGLALAGSGRWLPHPYEVPFVHELLRRDLLGAFAVVDLRRGGSGGNIHVELD